MAKKLPKPPGYFSSELKAVWKEVCGTVFDDTPASSIESMCLLLKTVRDARKSIEKDGVIVTDAKSNAIEHPALKVERDAAKALNELNRQWAVEQ